MANVDIRGGQDDPYINVELSPEEAAEFVEWWDVLSDNVDPYDFETDELQESWTMAADLVADLGSAAKNA